LTDPGTREGSFAAFCDLDEVIQSLLPMLNGVIVLVHGPRWSFTPVEGFPMGGMEIQVVLLGALYFLIAGNARPGPTPNPKRACGC
jgi:hypothetical protein